MKKFKVGDKVVIANTSKARRHTLKIGTVVVITKDAYGDGELWDTFPSCPESYIWTKDLEFEDVYYSPLYKLLKED